MKQELQNLLSEYLGELIYRHENTFDWVAKDAITRKINAVYELLGIGENKPTFLDAVNEVIKSKNKQ